MIMILKDMTAKLLLIWWKCWFKTIKYAHFNFMTALECQTFFNKL